MITDPISDTLTRIRNALSAQHETVDINYSIFIEKIVKLFCRIGYINQIKVYEKNNFKYITLLLKYDQKGMSVIRGIKRISKPGLRKYCNVGNIPIVNNGIGTAIISTSKGLMTTYKARQENIGGEIICFIW